MADSAYSFSLTTFNPSGKLLQIEYALNAVNNGGKTSLGIRTSNGVVIATEKKLPTILVDESSHVKISNLTSSAGRYLSMFSIEFPFKKTKSLGIVYSGLGPDSRVLVRKARKSAQKYYQVYKEEIPSSMLVHDIASTMQEFTQSGGVRPFGVSLLYAGFDEDGPHLYQIDPSGAHFGWKATAIGKDMVNAKTFLERRYNDEMELEDAIHTALLTLREGFEGEMNENNIEVAIVGEDKKFRVLTPSEIKDYLDEAE